MKRSTYISWVDGCSFISFFLLMITGFVLKFQLPPGSGRLIKEKLGRGALDRPLDLLWGLTRHEWGEIHLWLGLFLILAMILHLAIHWKWIMASFKANQTRETRIRSGIGIMAILTLVTLGILMLTAPSERTSRRDVIEDRGVNPQEVSLPATLK